MVLCNIECVQKISQYLDVSPGKLYVSENNVSTDKIIPTISPSRVRWNFYGEGEGTSNMSFFTIHAKLFGVLGLSANFFPFLIGL